MRQLFGYLQDHYKCRLHRLYVLNVPTSLYAPWQIIKRFLDEVTVQKVQLCKNQSLGDLLKSTNPEQVEEKYGGVAPNATQYWYFSNYCKGLNRILGLLRSVQTTIL